MLLGYTTGVAKSQIWTRNPVVWRKSRYMALSAANHSPTDSAVSTVSTTRSGIDSNAQPGTMPYAAISTIMIAKATAKSTRPPMIAANGINSRGQYVLVIRLWLSTRLLLDDVIACANSCQGRRAQKV